MKSLDAERKGFMEALADFDHMVTEQGLAPPATTAGLRRRPHRTDENAIPIERPETTSSKRVFFLEGS